MKFKDLVSKVNESKGGNDIPSEAFEMVDELSTKGFSEKDIRSKLKKKFPKINNNDLEILLKVA